MSVAIRVENLGKKYLLRHQAGGRSRYVALRDVLTHKVTSLFRHDRSTDKSREEFWALKNVSFEINQGEAVGIIGRNGAGKSTLLKLLSRITKPATGRIEINGRIASLLEVGTGFHPELTGRENIFLNGAILGMSRGEITRKFDEIVAFAEVEKFLDTPVKHFSSGMYMRLAFAVAAYLESEILIVDEVLAVGDASFQKKCLGKMQNVGQSGKTVLFVSHNMGAIAQLTSRCLLVAKGQIEYSGATKTAIEKYSFLGGVEPATVFDVEFHPRKCQADQSARILSLRFERKISQFVSDDPFSFVIKIRANKDLARLRTSITIFSIDGVAIGGAFSPDLNQMKRSQESEFRVTLPCPNLAPGHYYCDVGIGRGSPLAGLIDYDVVVDTLQFETYPRAGEDGTVGYWAMSWGKIMFPNLHIEPLA